MAPATLPIMSGVDDPLVGDSDEDEGEEAERLGAGAGAGAWSQLPGILSSRAFVFMSV